MFNYFLGFFVLVISSAYAQTKADKCENFYFKDSDKPYVICEYDFGKEMMKVIISKECILKKCEAYKAYEKALTVDISPRPGVPDTSWGTVNCMNLNGSLVWLSNDRQISGEMLFCKFKDYSFIHSIFLDTSRSDVFGRE